MSSSFQERLDKLCADLDYIGWDIHVQTATSQAAWIRVGTMVENSYPPAGRPRLPFGREVLVTSDMDNCEIKDEIRIMILALQDHEVHEFFKENGVPVVNVHDDDNNPDHWMSFDSRYVMIRDREHQYAAANA